jgi:hypothetical protein
VLHSVEVERQTAHVRIQVQAGVTGDVLTGERRYLTSYETARRELPVAVGKLGDLVSDNPGAGGPGGAGQGPGRPAGRHPEALVANVRANRPPASRAELLDQNLDQNKVTGDALMAQLQAMQDTEQRLLSVRQAEARRARSLALGAIGLKRAAGRASGRCGRPRPLPEHIVAWSPMVMFRGLLGGSGERATSAATSSGCSATPRRRC